jgi:hypothetical protein
VPAAAVIPAPIAYTKVVAVEKLVVGSAGPTGGPPMGGHRRVGPEEIGVDDATDSVGIATSRRLDTLAGVRATAETFTLKKLECSKQANAARIVLHGIMEQDLGAVSLVRVNPLDESRRETPLGNRGNDHPERTGAFVFRR